MTYRQTVQDVLATYPYLTCLRCRQEAKTIAAEVLEIEGDQLTFRVEVRCPFCDAYDTVTLSEEDIRNGRKQLVGSDDSGGERSLPDEGVSRTQEEAVRRRFQRSRRSSTSYGRYVVETGFLPYSVSDGDFDVE